MGRDTYVLLKKDCDGPMDNQLYYPFGRGLGTLVQNYHFGGNQIVPQIEKAIDYDMSFLFSPDYFNHHVNTWDIEFMPVDIQEVEYNRVDEEVSENIQLGWENIDDYRSQLSNLIRELKYNPRFYEKICYDRVYWLNYFDNGSFNEELIQFNIFLMEKSSEGYSLFTFDIE
jgi:hypothetical protein